MQTEQAVKMAAKLYECRDTAKRLLGDGYQKRMTAYAQAVEVFDSRCNYASFAGRVCNKCGRIHDGGNLLPRGGGGNDRALQHRNSGRAKANEARRPVGASV